jgi:hypothetical protein
VAADPLPFGCTDIFQNGSAGLIPGLAAHYIIRQILLDEESQEPEAAFGEYARATWPSLPWFLTKPMSVVTRPPLLYALALCLRAFAIVRNF